MYSMYIRWYLSKNVDVNDARQLRQGKGCKGAGKLAYILSDLGQD